MFSPKKSRFTVFNKKKIINQIEEDDKIVGREKDQN
jgi:hypothetical protein